MREVVTVIPSLSLFTATGLPHTASIYAEFEDSSEEETTTIFRMREVVTVIPSLSLFTATGLPHTQPPFMPSLRTVARRST